MGTQSHCPALLPSIAEILLWFDPPSTCLPSLPGDPSSGSTSHTKKTAQGFRGKKRNIHGHGGGYRHSTTIDMLPNNVLLEIFDFCQEDFYFRKVVGWKWHLLVHVCRRWRQIVFESPRRLDLQIVCTHGTPVRKNLDSWPAFPVAIHYYIRWDGIGPDDEDNIIAALEHPDRVCSLGLGITGSQLEKVSTVMQESFPVLTKLWITARGGNVPVLPGGFLGGSVPCLQSISLDGIPFPALPTLLLSASDLVYLTISNIPPTGYIPPEAMVVCLAALPRLDSFDIGFQSATPRPDRIRPPPITRSSLPALTEFRFKGASEYLEALVSRIDSPRLDWIDIDYLNQLVDIQVVQLTRFIDRSVGPELTLFTLAEVAFSSTNVTLDVGRHVNNPDWDPLARTGVSCEGIDWQVSHMAQVLSHISDTLSNVVHLKLVATLGEDRQLEGIDDAEWVYLLRQISTVQTLHVSQELAGHVALALEDIAEMVTEVLPSLDLIYLAGQPPSSIEKFIAAHQLSGRPVIVIDTETGFNKRLKSYVGK